MKYFRRVEGGEPEEISLSILVHGLQNEFMFDKYYYEWALINLGSGGKLIGSIHMYWVEV